jgi:hypothetical protein
MGALLEHFRAEGVTFEAMPDGKLRAHGDLTDELCAAIQLYKPAILRELAELTAANDAPRNAAPPAKLESDNTPQYRWLILESDGRRREVCTLPEMTRIELAACYPGALFIPLPDSAAEVGVVLGGREAA